MRERDPMSIFPTKILLATDGSKEAKLAFASAADLSEKTDSELHVVYVGHMPLVSYESLALQPLTRISQEGCKRVPSKRLEQCSTSRCSGKGSAAAR
jgi:hypothetical protein